jgi:rod shape-determining protein MreD
MRSFWLVIFGFGLLTAQAAIATLTPMHTFAPNLMLPIVMALGVTADVWIVRGALVSFVLGYLLDAFCGTPMGLNTFVLVSTFMLSRGASSRIFPQGVFLSSSLVFGMSLFTGFAVIALRAVFEKKPEIVNHDASSTAWVLFFTSLTTAVLSPFIFAMVQRIDGRLMQKTDERGSRA